MTYFTHTGTDQNWQDETTIYWFDAADEIEELTYGQIEEGEEFGVADKNGDLTVLDSDGCPVDSTIFTALTRGGHLIEAYREAVAAF